jgi:hypothetical protein
MKVFGLGWLLKTNPPNASFSLKKFSLAVTLSKARNKPAIGYLPFVKLVDSQWLLSITSTTLYKNLNLQSL